MRKAIFLFMCIILLLFSGCEKKSTIDDNNESDSVSNNDNVQSNLISNEKVTEYESDSVSNNDNVQNNLISSEKINGDEVTLVSNNDNVQSNLISGGKANEYEDVIIFNNYIYDKTSSEVSLLCKDPVCSHSQNINSAANSCILVKNLGCLQIYNGNILCSYSSDSNSIYKLDPQVGELSVFYEADIPISSFRLYGEHNAIVHSDDGFYAIDFETGKSLQLISGTVYNAFYTNDDNYLYISMENLTLHRIDLHTGEDIILVERGAQPVIHGGKLYYQYISEDEWCLYSINIDGSDNTLILDDIVSYSIYGDKIYYSTASYPRKSIICDTSGHNGKEVFSDSASFYIFPKSEKVIMWEHSNYSYKIMDLDGSNIEDLTVPELE